MNRQKYPTRTIILLTAGQRDRAIAALENAPLDSNKPLEFVLRERQKARGLDQNSLMWSGPLADISDQAYVNGRTYSSEVWHEHLKRNFLPEQYDEEMTKEGYQKWDYMPTGERVLVGSTTQLTTKGFSQYLEQVYAFGAGLGVMFNAKEAA